LGELSDADPQPGVHALTPTVLVPVFIGVVSVIVIDPRPSRILFRGNRRCFRVGTDWTRVDLSVILFGEIGGITDVRDLLPSKFALVVVVEPTCSPNLM